MRSAMVRLAWLSIVLLLYGAGPDLLTQNV